MGSVKASYPCMLTLAMDLVGGKWKMVILWQLRNGTERFSELKRQLSGITQKMLTQQLRELEEMKIINRKVYPVVPPKVWNTAWRRKAKNSFRLWRPCASGAHLMPLPTALPNHPPAPPQANKTTHNCFK